MAFVVTEPWTEDQSSAVMSKFRLTRCIWTDFGHADWVWVPLTVLSCVVRLKVYAGAVRHGTKGGHHCIVHFYPMGYSQGILVGGMHHEDGHFLLGCHPFEIAHPVVGSRLCVQYRNVVVHRPIVARNLGSGG